MRPSKDRIIIKVAGICGILAPIMAFTCIGVAILMSPWFSWTNNWLSDLGGRPGSDSLWATHGSASIVFNVGLMFTGVLGSIFAVGFRKSGMLKTSHGQAGTMLLFLVTGSLFGIGLFTESTGDLHVIFSVAFFVFAGLCVILIGMSLLKSSEKILGWITMVLLVFGLTSIPFFLIPKPIGGNAVAEMIPIISVAAFSIVFGFELIKRGSMSNGYEK